jgi:hypothetical protein
MEGAMATARYSPTDFIRSFREQPLWVRLWGTWLGMVNLAALAFITTPAGRWTALAFLVAVVVMSGLHTLYGYNRLLGLAHIVVWVPLFVFLVPTFPGLEGALRVWVAVLLATNAVCLAIDSVDVTRYALGDRQNAPYHTSSA